jgi:predicted NAD/FAD-binding protein
MQTLAIIGTGIAGLGAAHFLQTAFDLTVFEQNDRVGGHAHTVDRVEPGTGRTVPADTGFTVFNRVTYPLLSRLFDQLRIPLKPAPMSFSVRDESSGREWGGPSLNRLFAQRRHLFDRRFLSLLMTIRRFHREASAALEEPETATLTLADYVCRRGYGEDFFNLYLVPLGSALTRTPAESMPTLAAAGLLRFLRDQGFLGLRPYHRWWTLDGGARVYLDRLSAPLASRIRTGCAVVRVMRHRPGHGVVVLTADGHSRTFDKVIVATPAHQALRLLVNPTADERRLLGEFPYQDNVTTLHTDPSVMPRTRRAWASWNHHLARDAHGRLTAATHTWVNALQGSGGHESSCFVSTHRPEAIDPSKTIATLRHAHPLFTPGALQAQVELPALNVAARGATETYFAGGYFGYGTHEDAFGSAVRLAELLLERNPWREAPASNLTPLPE